MMRQIASLSAHVKSGHSRRPWRRHSWTRMISNWNPDAANGASKVIVWSMPPSWPSLAAWRTSVAVVGFQKDGPRVIRPRRPTISAA